jgi:hypothetical protein
MEYKGFGAAQDWLTGQKPAIMPAKWRESAFIRVDPSQVISTAEPNGERSFRVSFVWRRLAARMPALKQAADERRGQRPMKITVDVDCTPLEARQFMGLPDVEPMQKAAMAQIEKRMTAELERFSPEALFKAWLPIAGMNAEWLQEFLKRAAP